MESKHLFNFYSPEKDEYYSLKNVDFDKDYDIDATSKIIDLVGQKIIFTYDFGDSWEISINLEEIIKNSECPIKKIPSVIEGKGLGIIEDCGGIGGLEMIAEAFKKKEGLLLMAWC